MFVLKSRATHTSHLMLQTRCQFDNVKSYIRVGYVHETETSLGRLPVFDLYGSRRKKIDLRDLMRDDAMRHDAAWCGAVGNRVAQKISLVSGGKRNSFGDRCVRSIQQDVRQPEAGQAWICSAFDPFCLIFRLDATERKKLAWNVAQKSISFHQLSYPPHYGSLIER